MSCLCRKAIVLLSFFILISPAVIKAQIFHDTASMSTIKKEVDLIYNRQFNEARQLHAKVARRWPDHPALDLLEGITIYWENYPLMYESAIGRTFEETMKECIEKSEKKTDPANETEYLLANVSARGLLLLYLTDNEEAGKAIPLAISSYPLLRKSFDFADSYPDLDYFTGVYDYYREAYPNVYPIYKPVASLFPKGDKNKGITELERCAKHAIVLSAESYCMLSWIYAGFENNFSRAITYSSTVHKKYPENVLFASEYIKDLILLKRYDEAESLISGMSRRNEFFKAQLLIYSGLIYEKKYNDNITARQLYEHGISDIAQFGDYGKPYAAYACFGLSRIAAKEGNKESSRKHRREALKMADFKEINFD